MLFRRKTHKCNNCNSKINKKFSFCPYCGQSMIDEEKYARNYGLIGKNDEEGQIVAETSINLGITDKLIGSLMNSLMKNLDKQFKHLDKEFEKTEINNLPNGIKIRIGPSIPGKKQPTQKGAYKNQISEEQIKKMSLLPRTEAESKMKRLNNKIIYELKTPGIQSPHDVFVSKLESGYEIKAIAEKKVYVNSLPVNLPLKSLSITDDKLFLEFLAN